MEEFEMNWFKNLFKTDQLSKDIGKVILPSVENLLPMSEIKPPKPEKDISEPVLSFVECVRANRKRFVLDSSTSIGRDTTWRPHSNKAYRVYDKKFDRGWIIVGEVYSYSNSMGWYHEWEEEPYFEQPEFLTGDEKFYLIRELNLIADGWKDRKEIYYKQRHNRRLRDERNRLKELYK